MPTREAEAAQRVMRLATTRAALLERMHAAIRLFTARARAGGMASERAIALISALLEGHAVAELTPTLERGKSRLAIVAAPNAPAEVRALLEQALPPKLDPAESALVQARTHAPPAAVCVCGHGWREHLPRPPSGVLCTACPALACTEFRAR